MSKYQAWDALSRVIIIFTLGAIHVLLTLISWQAYEARLSSDESARLLRERNQLFREWTTIFHRIEERQALFLTTVRSEVGPEQWARIEELNRDAGLK